MARIPAKCNHCDHVFFSGISVSGFQGLKLDGNRQRCPRCGGWAQIVEGTFDVGRDGVFHQTDGEALDSELFTRLGLILIQAKIDKLKPHEIVEKVAPHSSQLAERLRKVADNPAAFSAVIVALIGAFGAIAVALVNDFLQKDQATVQIIINEGVSVERGKDALEQMRREKRDPPPWSSDYI